MNTTEPIVAINEPINTINEPINNLVIYPGGLSRIYCFPNYVNYCEILGSNLGTFGQDFRNFIQNSFNTPGFKIEAYEIIAEILLFLEKLTKSDFGKGGKFAQAGINFKKASRVTYDMRAFLAGLSELKKLQAGKPAHFNAEQTGVDWLDSFIKMNEQIIESDEFGKMHILTWIKNINQYFGKYSPSWLTIEKIPFFLLGKYCEYEGVMSINYGKIIDMLTCFQFEFDLNDFLLLVLSIVGKPLESKNDFMTSLKLFLIGLRVTFPHVENANCAKCSNDADKSSASNSNDANANALNEADKSSANEIMGLSLLGTDAKEFRFLFDENGQPIKIKSFRSYEYYIGCPIDWLGFIMLKYLDINVHMYYMIPEKIGTDSEGVDYCIDADYYSPALDFGGKHGTVRMYGNNLFSLARKLSIQELFDLGVDQISY